MTPGRRPLLVFLMWLATIALGTGAHAQSNEWRITAVDPLSNRPALSVDETAAVLSDGKLAPPPAWTGSSTAGWHRLTPISVTIDALSAAARSAGSLRLRVHAAYYDKAGITAPRRIDIYRGEPRNLRYAGTLSPAAPAKDRGGRWLESTVSGPGTRLVLVIHADRTSAFIDEIEIAAVAATAHLPDAGDNVSPSIADVRADSLRRLELQIAHDPCTPLSPQGAGETPQFTAWLTDPLGLLPASGPNDTLNNSTLELHGIEGTVQYMALGIRTRSPATFAVTTTGGPDATTVRWYRLQRIMNALGEFVFDAAVPLASPDDMRLDSSCTQYFLAEVRLDGTAVQRVTVDVHADVGPSRQLVMELHSYRMPQPPKLLAVNPFLYTSHAPQVGQARAVMDQAFADGVNVMVIPRNHVPQPGTSVEEQRSTMRRLREDLRLAHGDTQVLLALGWQQHQAPSFLSKAERSGLRSGERLSAWLETLRAELQHAGVSKDRWALYVVDEPAAGDIDWVAHLLRQLHEAKAGTRLYLTLATALPEPTASALFRTAAETNTIVQAKADVAPRLQHFLRGLPAGWWIYSVPREPAKSSSPIADHTSIAWLGWALDARGVGVWAYADSRRSSAWDDLDGETPDWSLVYEQPGAAPPLRSRRWIGFLQGVSDLRLLDAATHTATGNSRCASTLNELRNAITSLPANLRERESEDALAAQIRQWRATVLRHCALPSESTD